MFCRTSRSVHALDSDGRTDRRPFVNKTEAESSAKQTSGAAGYDRALDVTTTHRSTTRMRPHPTASSAVFPPNWASLTAYPRAGNSSCAERVGFVNAVAVPVYRRHNKLATFGLVLGGVWTAIATPIWQPCTAVSFVLRRLTSPSQRTPLYSTYQHACMPEYRSPSPEPRSIHDTNQKLTQVYRTTTDGLSSTEDRRRTDRVWRCAEWLATFPCHPITIPV